MNLDSQRGMKPMKPFVGGMELFSERLTSRTQFFEQSLDFPGVSRSSQWSSLSDSELGVENRPGATVPCWIQPPGSRVDSSWGQKPVIKDLS